MKRLPDDSRLGSALTARQIYSPVSRVLVWVCLAYRRANEQALKEHVHTLRPLKAVTALTD